MNELFILTKRQCQHHSHANESVAFFNRVFQCVKIHVFSLVKTIKTITHGALEVHSIKLVFPQISINLPEMSSQRGSGETRKRAQKHKNSFAFKNDLHDKTPQMKKINTLNVCEVCERCKAQIEWKIKYKKYKPLSQAKTCVK